MDKKFALSLHYAYLCAQNQQNTMKNNTLRFITAIQQATPQTSTPARPRRRRATLGPTPSPPHIPFHQVHPKNWWTGMENPFLQVMIHEPGVKFAQLKLEDPDGNPLDPDISGIRLLCIETVQNPNYLFVNLDLSQAHPQSFQFHLTFSTPQVSTPSHLHLPYALTPKNAARRLRPSFSSADVLYLLMPDRFVNIHDVDPTAPDFELTPEQQELGPMLEPVTGKSYRTEHLPDKSAGRHGGNLAGIDYAVEQGYFDDLGITTLWPTPVQVNNVHCSYHGYAITDYYEIDPRLGNLQGYKQLVAHCHAHGLKMVMDMVFNHCGINHFLYLDLPDPSWFNYDSRYTVNSTFHTDACIDPYASHDDVRRFGDGWFNAGMPDWNQRNPLVRNYLIQNSIWWIEEADIDGIRQDTYPYIDQVMARDWCLAVRREYPNFNIVGETWLKTAVGAASLQKDSPIAAFNTELPTVMDFELQSILSTELAPHSCVPDPWGLGLGRLYNYLTADRIYANPDCLLTFLGNHDMSRFHKTAESAMHCRNEYKCALTLLLTLRGIPQLYFGDELGMYGERKGVDCDGEFRTDFGTGTASPLSSEAAVHDPALRDKAQDYFRLTSTLLHWRRSCPAAHHGKITQFTIDDRELCYVFGRSLRDEHGQMTSGFVVIVNASYQDKRLNLMNSRYRELLPAGAQSARNVLTRRTKDLHVDVEVRARDCVLLEF